MNRPLVAVVLAGGIGTRLYPATTSNRPKQFRSFDGAPGSLLERAIDRADFADHRAVVPRQSLAGGVRERAPGDVAVLVEPEPRDSGPALVYAARRLRERYDDPVLVVLPSDHVVDDAGAFAATMRRGARVAAATGSLVVFGTEPTLPETGYGYLELGADRGDYAELRSFHEKPDEDTAERYVEAGHLWNAGAFAWTPSAFLTAARSSPLRPLVEADDLDERAWDAVPSVSVDDAVLERTNDVVAVPADYEWDDLGTWDAVGRHAPADADGNAALSDYTAIDATDNVVAGDGETHVSLVGVENLVVAAYGDRVLVVPRGKADRVRDLSAEPPTRGE